MGYNSSNVQYDFQIEYVATDKFGCADILSRLIAQQTREDEDFVIAALHLEEDLEEVLSSSVTSLPKGYREVEVIASSSALSPEWMARFADKSS